MSANPDLGALIRSLHDEHVLTVSLDLSASDPAQRRRWRIELSRCVGEQRAALARSPRFERGQFESAVARLEEHLGNFHPWPRALGWVGFITAGAVRHEEYLPNRVPTRVAWDVGARIAWFVEAQRAADATVVVLVDGRKAELFGYSGDTVVLIDTVYAETEEEAPLHMGDAARPGFHPGTRGSTGRDEHQRHRAAATEAMVREAAGRALALAGSSRWILVAGIPRQRARLYRHLNATVLGRVQQLPDLDVHATPALIAAAAREASGALRKAADAELLAELEEQAGPAGRVAFGAEATLEALGARRVGALYFSPRYAAADPPGLEWALQSALSQGADASELADGAGEALDEHGGIAARLRH